MLPNGKAIFFGATPHNAIYTPTGTTAPGAWTAAADFPTIGGVQMGQSDASAAMMVNGKILCAVAPYYSSFPPPTFFVEYDYTNNTFTQVTAPIPGMGGDSINVPSYQTQMLDLPDGTVLLSISQAGSMSTQYYVYTPGSPAIPEGKPTINSILPDGCPNYKITGKLFNGISEGAAYGDDWEMSTNYPLVRLTNGTNVYYARTSYWNRIGAVQTDSLEDTAIFTMPTIPAGTYSLVVVVNGFASNPVLWTTLGLNVPLLNNVACNGGFGSATVSGNGGIAPYTYLWAPGGATNSSESGLSIGTYTVTVTDNNGCTNTNSLTITQPNLLSAMANPTTNVNCNGNNTGVASSVLTGGTTPYTYSWSSGGATGATTSNINASGNYTVTITDANNCSTVSTFSLSQPAALNASITSANDSCYGSPNGSAALAVTGGVLPYTYMWSNSATTEVVGNLSAGSYSVTLNDAHGCNLIDSVTITQPAQLTSTTSSTNATGGQDNGSASVSNIAGGVAPYNIHWSNGQVSGTINNLAGGTYVVIVSDQNGCERIDTVVVNQLVGINTAQGDVSFAVYPNPANTAFTIELSQLNKATTLSIKNVLGETVLTQTIAALKTKIDITFNDSESK